MKKTIQVTKDHIEQGERADPYLCMIAKAMFDAGVSSPYVVYNDEDIDGSFTKLVVKLGGEFGEQQFIDHGLHDIVEAWDDGTDPEPFEFEIEVPEETN